MEIALLSLGSNLGNRETYLQSARDSLEAHPNIHIIESSPILNTEAMDVLDQPDFLNQVIAIETSLEPIDLLDFLQYVEKKLGRVLRYDKGPREIDIDILVYGNQRIQSHRLIIPHHSIESRPFIRRLMDTLSISS